MSNSLDQAKQFGMKVSALKAEIGKVVVGQDEVVEALLNAVFCHGHVLMVGVPGLAKTLLVKTLSQTLELSFNRIQFTPDLMPSDIIGSEILDDSRKFHFVKGPIFSNIILADEINRTPPKTQAALLEAMQERQVTAAGQRYDLEEPFFVLATQNPIEQEGTYPLPEAQQDRFMFKVFVNYPTFDEEFEIARRTTASQQVEVRPVLDADDILKLQRMVREVPVSDHVIRYALSLVRQTRVGTPGVPDFIRDQSAWGAGPRAVQFLILGAKARALLHGRGHATVEDIAALAKPTLRHRLVVNFAAESDGITADQLIDRIVLETPTREDELTNDARFKKIFAS